MNWKLLSQLLIFALIVIAFSVTVGLAAGANMWKFIIVYWFVLTVKNLMDFVIARRSRKYE